MSNHNVIVVKGEGHFAEGILQTGFTPKPGTLLVLTSATGAKTYKPWDGAADGEQDEVVLLVEDEGLGQLKTTAYTDTAAIRIYFPVRGDEFQVLVTSGENITIGDKLIIKDVTGKCIETTGSPEMEPFKALETLGALAADTHCLVRMIA